MQLPFDTEINERRIRSAMLKSFDLIKGRNIDKRSRSPFQTKSRRAVSIVLACIKRSLFKRKPLKYYFIQLQIAHQVIEFLVYIHKSLIEVKITVIKGSNFLDY